MRIHLLNGKNLETLPCGVNGDGRAVTKDYNDGGGLYLIVGAGGSRSWMFKYTWAGQPKKMGLGSLLTVSKDKARQLAQEARAKVQADINPLIDRPGTSGPQRVSPTFLDYARLVMATKTHGMKDKSVAQWVRGVEVYAKPLHKKQIADITRRDIVACLEPIWLEIPIAASGFRARLEVIFRHALSNEVLPQDHKNPADWTHLQDLLKKQPAAGTIRGAHKALDYNAMPAFWTALVARDTTSSKTLQFAILTCVRTGEALQAQWDQVDLEHGRWALPARVMKNGKQADVPLSSDAIELLTELKELHQQAGYDTTKGYIFRGLKRGTMQSENTLLKLIQEDLGYGVTTHGFRSTFRTWSQNTTAHDRDTLEYCLHHITGDAAELAYKRGDMWDKRQVALQDWANFVAGRQVPARRGRPPKLRLVEDDAA